MKVLVTGGSGYIGTSLVPALLKRDYEVTVLDNLMYDQNVFLECYINKNFSFIYGDIRDQSTIKKERALAIHTVVFSGFREVKITGDLDEKLLNTSGAKEKLEELFEHMRNRDLGEQKAKE